MCEKMKNYLLKNATVVNEGKQSGLDVRISKGRIEKIAAAITPNPFEEVIDCSGKFLIPGVIDDQVHFREPGLTHKGDIFHESRAAVAGGVTSFMEMPNTNPAALTLDLLEDKYSIASKNALANYSFFMGTSNTNLEELLKLNPNKICGIKIFMGSSTGNLLVDDSTTLEKIFAECNVLIATHCEDEQIVKDNLEKYFSEYGDAGILPEMHPLIRSRAACIKSSSYAIDLATKHNTRLHILHLTTAEEVLQFDNTKPLAEKRITSEVCVHHLWFSQKDYGKHGFLIKCNPAIKTEADQEALWNGLWNNNIDIIATDHAPHTWEEKQSSYSKNPSGLPLVRFPLLMMMHQMHERKFSLESLVEKMCHNPAICFQIKERGFIREGYWADLVLIDPYANSSISKSELFYKCGWSLFEGFSFNGRIHKTFVSGNLAYDEGKIVEFGTGKRLEFERT